MKTYIIYDSKLKDGLRKKINDESITIEGDWSKEGINAAKRMGLTFTLTGRYENGFPVAKISGDKQKLIKYFKKWYDPDFFDEDYDVFDSKTKDSSINPDTTYKLEYNYYNADVYDNDDINKEKIEFQKELRKYNLKIISLKQINSYDGNVSAIIEGKGRDIKKFMRHAGEPDEEVISEMIIS